MRDNNDVHRKVNVLIDERWMLNNKSAQKNNKRPDQWTTDEAQKGRAKNDMLWSMSDGCTIEKNMRSS